MTETLPTAQELEQNIWQLVKAGRLHDAAAACDQLNQAFPDFDSGWNTSSRVAINLNEPVIALQAVQRALLISPGKPEWLLQKMACLAVYGDLKAANVIADELAQHAFNSAYHASSCAVIMNRLNRFEDSERHYRRALELNPDNPNFRYNLATAQRAIGKVDEATTLVEEILSENPADSEAQFLRSSLRKQTESNNNLDSLHTALERVPEEHPGRAQLLFALAKELNDLRRFDESFRRLQQGASKRRSKITYDADLDLQAMRVIRDTFNKELFASAEEGFVNAEAIFVIGMPRSGIAVVDRILGRHSVVRSIGASQAFGVEIVNQVEKTADVLGGDTIKLIKQACAVDFAALGEAYVENARPAGKSNAHFVNKLPNNFMYAGLIRLALPKAKIILLERDPMDICYAMFKTLFSGKYPYSYDLDELANYIVAYRQLMDHWRAVMPGVIHTVSYEALVADSRPVIEDLLQYCDLSFEDACLNYQAAVDSANTGGGVDAAHSRRAKSIGYWKNYSDQLEPVAEILRSAGYG